MKTNPEDTQTKAAKLEEFPPIEGFSQAFPGSNSVMVQVRVSENLFGYLEAQAKQAKLPLPDLVRNLLAFHGIPYACVQHLEAAKILGKDIIVPQKGQPDWETYKAYLFQLEELCKVTDAFKKRVLHLKKEWLSLEKLMQKVWRGFFKR